MLCDKCSGRIGEDGSVFSSIEGMLTPTSTVTPHWTERMLTDRLLPLGKSASNEASGAAQAVVAVAAVKVEEDNMTNKDLSCKKPTKPLVINVTMWVGGTDTEWCLVKMNPDTPFNGLLEKLRQNHPRKQLKNKKSGKFVFGSDTPASVGLEDGAELDFFQEGGEPALMLDMTAN